MKKTFGFVVLLVTFILTFSQGGMEAKAIFDDPDHPSYSYLNPQQSARYDQVVKQVLKGVDKKWSVEEKLFYLHDYIVTHTRYRVNHKNSANAYGCMVEHEAQCAGYALAFCDIANKMGVETKYIVGSNMNHAWNAVKLKGKWYYIDCTFDDGGQGFFSLECRHDNFLRSESGMRQTDHYGSDWRHGHSGERVVGRYTSSAYEKAEWRNNSQDRPFTCLSNGVVYYTGGYENTAVCTYDCKRGRVKRVIENSDISGIVSFAAKGKNFFVNGAQSIYYYDSAKNSVKKVYELDTEEKLYGRISQLSLCGKMLRYDIGGSGETAGDETVCGYLDITKLKEIVVKEIKMEDVLSFSKPGEVKKLNVTSTGVSSLTWESDDPSVATVNNGVVTAIKRGGCYVTAKGDGISAKCLVLVTTYSGDNAVPVPAKDTNKPDTTWQNDFSFSKNEYTGKIFIYKYKGYATDLIIPAKAIINGKEYITVLNGSLLDNSDNTVPDRVVSLKCEKGVQVKNGLRIATACKNLVSIDLTGCDTAYLSSLLIGKDCPKLSYVNFGGLDFFDVIASDVLVDNCPKLAAITTPRIINPYSHLELPGVWHTRVNNEWGAEEYKLLNKVPGNTTIYMYTEPCQKGMTFSVNGITYRVTDADAGKVSVKGISGKNANIPSVFTYNGKRYMVCSIDKKAAQNNKKLETLTIGKSITSIGDYAFNKCSKLKSIRVNSGSIKKIGKHAFKGTSAKMKIVVPKDMKSTYATMFKKAGCGKNVSIKTW